MQKVQIGEARAIAERVQADAVVVFAFKDGRFAAASYGATKAKCGVAGRWLDAVVAGMNAGTVPPPDL